MPRKRPRSAVSAGERGRQRSRPVGEPSRTPNPSAVLEESIARLGSQYALGLRARSCQTGDILADAQTQASGKEQVVASLGPIAAKFTKRIEQSLAKVEKPAPLEAATTSSLDALKSFSTATKVKYQTASAAAVGHYQRAIALDPQFATAYARLGL